MTDVLPVVRYIFESSADPTAGWAVVTVRSHEGLSEIYECVLDLVHDTVTVNPWDFVGRSATLTIERAGLSRKIHGVLHRVERIGVVTGRLVVRVYLRPALETLAHRVDTRIFQNLDAQKILKQVLDKPLWAFGRTARFDLKRTPAVREYCVQYRESDLDFVRRLAEEEGIWWYFDHTGDDEELVLTDSPAGAPVLETPGGSAIEVRGAEADTAEYESVRHFEASRVLDITSVVARDFDWTRPTLDMTYESRSTDANGMDREAYDYPAGFVIGAYDQGAKQYTHDDGTDRVTVRHDELLTRERHCLGESYVTAFSAGSSFTLEGHRDASLNRAHLLTRVDIVGENRDELHDRRGGRPGIHSYRNVFESVASDAPFRAAHRTPRPIVDGPQTATVVGPSGEEIYTDEHGRVKVQFHWDRKGTRDEKSSCWIRVSHVWAGPGWGFVFIPRIGMEVIVTFLEGDPDRPMITGCVYNGQNTPPYTLPDDKTRSTIKTNSSPGGGGFNELRLEDLAGSEEIFLHAQKDFNETVEHNHTTTVHNHQSNSIDCNHSETVQGNQTLTVHHNRNKTVEKTETNIINDKRFTQVKPHDRLEVNGTSETIINGTQSHTVNAGNGGAGAQTEKIAQNRDVHVGGNDTLDVGANKKDTIGAIYGIHGGPKIQLLQGGTTFTFEGGHVDLNAAGYIEIKHGSGIIKIEDSGKVSITAGPELIAALDTAGMQLKDDKIVVAAPAIQMLGGGGVVSIDPSGVSMAGAMIRAEATGDHEITGPIVVII
jgi:type VI secretion system secreted protein VgrG